MQYYFKFPKLIGKNANKQSQVLNNFTLQYNTLIDRTGFFKHTV